MESQQIIRVSAHAILQSKTLYILQNTHKTSLITFVNSCSACTAAVLVLRSPQPSSGAIGLSSSVTWAHSESRRSWPLCGRLYFLMYIDTVCEPSRYQQLYPEKQVTEMDAGIFSNNYSKHKQTISCNRAIYAFVIHNALKIFEKCLVTAFVIHGVKRQK